MRKIEQQICDKLKEAITYVYSDFAECYNATDRPKRLTQAFKTKMLNGVDIDTVKRHVEAHYHNAAE